MNSRTIPIESLKDREPYLDNCPRCSACKWSPAITHPEFPTLCPSYHFGRFHSYSASGKLITAYALLHGLIECDEPLLDSVYACSNCGGCDVGCKANYGDSIEPMASIYSLRAHIVAQGRLPQSLQRLLDNLRRSGNAAGRPPADRGLWCAGLPIKQWPRSTGSTLLHVGDLAFDATIAPVLRSVAHQIAASGADLVIGGADEGDIGALAFDIGDAPLALELARAYAEKVLRHGVKAIICCDDGSFAALRTFFPRLGVTLDGVHVEHVTQWLDRHGHARATDAPAGAKRKPSVVYHDACRLGRLSDPYQPWDGQRGLHESYLLYRTSGVATSYGDRGVYAEPRRMLARVADVVEMPRSREFAFCCGNAAGAREFNPAFAEAAALNRLEEAATTGADTMVTSCAGCAGHLQQTATRNGLAITVKSLLAYLHEHEEAARAAVE